MKMDLVYGCMYVVSKTIKKNNYIYITILGYITYIIYVL